MRKTPKEVYQEYRQDGVGSFAEWIGISKPDISMARDGRYFVGKLCRTRYSSNFIYGEPCRTLKEAKQSYKCALNAHLKEMRAWNARLDSDD